MILDASSVLAYLHNEPGRERVRHELRVGAVMSAANLAEVTSRVAERGISGELIAQRLMTVGLQIVPFTDVDVRIVGSLRPRTRRLGLSLGDRACLSLAIRLESPVLTADRAWASVREQINVELLR